MIELLLQEISQIFMALFMLAMFISYMMKAEQLEREAIEKGFAFYDTKTKKFTWRDSDAQTN